MHTRKQSLRVMGLAAIVLGFAIGRPVQAEHHGYVISLMLPAMNSTDNDCPEGFNPNLAGMLRRILAQQGMAEAEIEKVLLSKEFNARGYSRLATFRGRIDGKPVNVYRNPTSEPDPKIKLMSASTAYGFDLDGRRDKLDITDPLTGEKGIDNAAARVFGCFESERGTLEAPNGRRATGWEYFNHDRTWLIDVNSSGGLQDADDVEVRFFRGLQPASTNSAGYLRHMTYTVDPDPRLQQVVFKGRIKNGMFLSDTPADFYLIANSWFFAEVDLKHARLRLTFKEDGSVEGFLGGYMPVQALYYYRAKSGGVGESNASGVDAPGVYYALHQQADTDIDKDPKTDRRTRISNTFQIRAVPAFLAKAKLAASP